MDQEKIRSVIKEKIDKLSDLSRKIGLGFDKSDIHDFRVTIKTLRSFLRLLRSQPHRPGLKIPKSFKRLYHIAGAIRDAQLELEQLEGQISTIPHYIDKLHKVLDSQKNEWHKHYSKKILHKLEHRLLHYKYEQLDSNSLSGFFSLQFQAIDRLNKIKSPSDNQVHTARKKVKDILYTAKLSKKKWNEAYKQVPGISIKDLKHIADVIGDYNDQRLMLEHLISFSSRTLGAEEKNNIRRICIRQAKELKAKKKSVMEVVLDLSQPVQNRKEVAG